MQPSAVIPTTHVLCCLLSHYYLEAKILPSLRIFVESVALLSQVLQERQHPKDKISLLHTQEYVTVHIQHACVQKPIVLYTKHTDRIQFPQRKQDILVGGLWRRGSVVWNGGRKASLSLGAFMISGDEITLRTGKNKETNFSNVLTLLRRVAPFVERRTKELSLFTPPCPSPSYGR